MKKYATSTGYLIYRASVPPHEHKNNPQVSKCWCQDTRGALSADGSSNCIWVLDVTCEVPEEDDAGAKRPKKRPAVTLSPQNHGNPDISCRFTCGYNDVPFYQIDIERVKNIYLLPLIQQQGRRFFFFFKEPQHKSLKPGLNLSGTLMDASAKWMARGVGF